jgi:hypothetical protein
MSKYQDKFIAFVDILGFEDLVERSGETDPNAPTAEYILSLTDEFALAAQGPGRLALIVCPCAARITQDLDFRVTQVSDSVVISAETSPAGAINLVGRCYGIMVRLLKLGHLCRGYVTRGKIFHSATRLFGPGYQRAYKGEKSVSTFHASAEDRGTPFIGIDPVVGKFITEQGDDCLRKMFARFAETDGTSFAITPFLFLRILFGSVFDNDFSTKGEVTMQQIRDIVCRLVLQLDEIGKHADARGRSKIEHWTTKLNQIINRNEEDFDMIRHPRGHR